MLDRFSATDRRAFVDGLSRSLSTMPAMASWGLVTGVALSKSTLTLPQAFGMTLAVYAGSAQLATLPLFAAQLPIWTVLLTAAMVNVRFLIFSAGLAPHFCHLPRWRRVLLGYLNGDVIYLHFVQRDFPPGPQPGKEAFFWGLAVSNWVGWQTASIAGILLANLVPDRWGFSLAGTLALIPLMVSAVANRAALTAVFAAAVVALLSFHLPYRLGLLLAVLAALVAGATDELLAERADLRRIRRRGGRAGADGPDAGARS